MPADPVLRRLAAILVADVVGYSRLMGEAESYVRLVMEERPDFSIGSWRRPYWWKDTTYNERLMAAFAKAGLPE